MLQQLKIIIIILPRYKNYNYNNISFCNVKKICETKCASGSFIIIYYIGIRVIPGMWFFFYNPGFTDTPKTIVADPVIITTYIEECVPEWKKPTHIPSFTNTSGNHLFPWEQICIFFPSISSFYIVRPKHRRRHDNYFLSN